MSIAEVLARGRAGHPRLLVDSCTIARPGTPVLDEGTGIYATPTSAVYDGPCQIKPAQTATVDAAGVAVDSSRPVLDLPWSDVPIAAPGDLVTVTAGPSTGELLEVYAELTGTTSTSRRYTCEARGVLAGD